MSRKHRIFKYSNNWYAECGACVRSLWSPQWGSTLNLLLFHTQDHSELQTEPRPEEAMAND